VDKKETYAFAERLMREVWEPQDPEAVPRFYNREVVGHHRAQDLDYDDVVNRLNWDRKNNADPVFDVRDVVADEDKFAIRFLYTATYTPTGEKFETEAYYFYHLREGKVAEFWLLGAHDFDYKAPA
jgi:predicted ester cyclase